MDDIPVTDDILMMMYLRDDEILDDPDYGGEIYEIPQSSYTPPEETQETTFGENTPQLPKEKIKIELNALETF